MLSLVLLLFFGFAACAGPQTATTYDGRTDVADGTRVAGTAAAANATGSTTSSDVPDPYTEHLTGTTVSFEMVPVPSGMMQDSTGATTLPTPGFWISSTEITWDVYDVYVFALDGNAGPAAADAVAKPSKPYVLPGDDFGHAGMPALGMTSRAAERFVEWLSAKTGKSYRILNEDEWEYACALSTGGILTGDRDEAANERLDVIAWHRGNGGDGTHPVGSREAGELGLYDILGNAAEWVYGRDDQPVVKGGSYLDRPARVGCDARRPYSRSWQMTDPQIPKSPWWLSDGPFLSLRIARDFDS